MNKVSWEEYRSAANTMKKSSAVNEYLTGFFDLIGQLPTKDMDTVRQIVGQWPQIKQTLKALSTEAAKDEDSEYVNLVMEDFKKATALLDKLESHYKGTFDFDLEGIKTHSEPIIKLIEKMKPQEEQPPMDAAPAEDLPSQEPAMDEPMVKTASEVIPEEFIILAALDSLSSKVQTKSEKQAMDLDQLADDIQAAF